MAGVVAVETEFAPKPRGAYVQAVVVGDLVFCSTQLPTEPKSGRTPDSAYEQALQCFSNLEAVCRAAGTEMRRAVQMRFYFVDRDDLPAIDRAFREWFQGAKHSRVPIHVVSLAEGAQVSVEAVVSR